MSKVRRNEPTTKRAARAPRELAVTQLRALAHRLRSDGKRTGHAYFHEVAYALDVSARVLEHTRDASAWCYMVSGEVRRRAEQRVARLLEPETKGHGRGIS